MKKRTVALIVTGALTAVICGVMNLVFIPQIESTTEGVRCFDMNFGYSFETAQRFLSLLSEEGRSVYLTRQLPLDFFYPLAYGAFFILLICTLTRKKSKLALLPVFLMLADYCENICVILMLKSDGLSKTLVGVASIATSVKTVLMYLCFVMIVVLIVLAVRNRKKQAA